MGYLCNKNMCANLYLTIISYSTTKNKIIVKYNHKYIIYTLIDIPLYNMHNLAVPMLFFF